MADDLIVSFGTNCEVTHNLRRVYGLDEAHPFDWWITPLPALKPLIENGFAFDITDDNLERTDDGMSVINRRWKILHHHDFPRKDGQIRDDWRDFTAEAADKYGVLARRLTRRLDEARTVTVFINGNGGHEYLTREARLACSQPRLYAETFAALRLRWPGLSIRPVICNPSSLSEAPEDALVLAVRDYGDREPGKEFAKSPQGWAEALSSLPWLADHRRNDGLRPAAARTQS